MYLLPLRPLNTIDSGSESKGRQNLLENLSVVQRGDKQNKRLFPSQMTYWPR